MLKERIGKSNRVLVVGHEFPDGDAVGSVVAFKRVFSRLFPSVEFVPYFPTPPGGKFNFLGERFVVGDELRGDFDALVSLDVSTVNRLGIAAKYLSKVDFSVNIDHHLDNERFAEVNVVKSAPSTTCVLYFLLKEEGIRVIYEEAVPLYLGLVTDTGNFSYSCTDSSAFKMAEELFDLGDLTWVAREVFLSHPVEYLHLLSLVFQTAKLDGAVLSAEVRTEFLERTGLSLADAPLLVDHVLIGGKGAEVVVVFKEEGDLLKVSLRSRKVDLRSVAKKFGGGGHPRACGIKLRGKISEWKEKILEACAEAVAR